MHNKIRTVIALSGVLSLAAMSGSASAAAPLIKSYNSIPGHVPGNVISEGFEANAISELGDEVTLVSATPHVRKVRVIMSSWGCESGHWYSNDCLTSASATFTLPITLNIYAGNGGPSPGALLVTQTRTFAVRYRPSLNSSKCTGGNAGKWWSKIDHVCYNGFAQSIVFGFPAKSASGKLLLPNQVVWTIAFNTTHYGYSPVGEGAGCFTSAGGCGYDSLNLGVESFSGQPSAGTDVDSNGAYVNANTGFYCDGGPGGTLRLDTNGTSDCWEGYRPLATIKTN